MNCRHGKCPFGAETLPAKLDNPRQLFLAKVCPDEGGNLMVEIDWRRPAAMPRIGRHRSRRLFRFRRLLPQPVNQVAENVPHGEIELPIRHQGVVSTPE